MSKYQRKTIDTYTIYSRERSSGPRGKAWDLETTETSYKALKAQLKCYRENAPQLEYKYEIKRVPKDET